MASNKKTEIKSPGQKRYDVFMDNVKKAYADDTREFQYRKGQNLWKEVKKNAEKYEEPKKVGNYKLQT